MNKLEFSDLETNCFVKKNNGGDYKRQLVMTNRNSQLHEIFRNSNIILTILLEKQSSQCRFCVFSICGL